MPGSRRSAGGYLGLAGAPLALACVLAGPAAAREAAAPPPAAEALGELSLEELAQIKVTSVSRRAEPVSQAPSSIYVIANDAILRSGAMSLPELLRLAPNLEVMRIDALDYSITTRGFAGFESANKLLVLMDGRSIYTPLFSGVDWDQHHTILEDIERIEVISGPGGVLWGANAVNGVVNITTKSAFDTEGLLASARVGTLDSDVRLRIGGALGEDAAGRLYATAFRRGDLDTASGEEARDGWDGWRAGARFDAARDRDSLTLQGEIQDADIDESLGAEAGYVRGGNVLARWARRLGSDAGFEVQAYYDQITREARLIHDEQRVWDVSAQADFILGERHRLVAGGGFRVNKDEFRTLFEPQLLSPPRRRTEIGNVFVQDDVALGPNLTLTLGLKLETNSYTQADWMPNARIAWRVAERQFLWAAVSRAIRNPSRIERDFTIAGVVEPGRMGSEKLLAYEAGWRGWVGARSNASVTLFYHDYEELRTNELTPPGGLPIFVGNGMEGETYGVEAWADVQLTERWRISLGGSVMGKELRTVPLDVSRFEAGGADPDWWGKVRSHFDITDRLKLDVGLRAYDDIPRLAAAGYVGTDAYVEADARLAWQATDALEVSVTGRNLLHERHAEASEARRSEIPRSVHVGLRWMR